MIKVKNLWKKYGNMQVLKGLELEVFENETLVILGRSGVGKSVLLRQILGLETPDEGVIEIDDEKVSEFEKRESYRINKPMGMLFQGAALFDSMTVEQNVAFYLNEHEPHLKPGEIRERVNQALKLVGLENTQEKMPSELSGGMRKRAALARLIVYRPRIILYDEPTTGLDPITAAQINDLINTTKAELKATSIVVTHDLHSALEVGDRLAFHHDGIIELIAPKNEFFQKKNAHLEQFLKDALISFPQAPKPESSL